ncbi:MAG: hypothetical protein QM765_10045 [Myxococcales bacterium]
MATSAEHSTTAAAPSETGQTSKKCSGSAIGGLLVGASLPSRMPSIVMRVCTCANGLCIPFSWFLMDTIARWRRVSPYFSMYRRVNMPASEGRVTP